MPIPFGGVSGALRINIDYYSQWDFLACSIAIAGVGAADHVPSVRIHDAGEVSTRMQHFDSCDRHVALFVLTCCRCGRNADTGSGGGDACPEASELYGQCVAVVFGPFFAAVIRLDLILYGFQEVVAEVVELSPEGSSRYFDASVTCSKRSTLSIARR